MLRSNTLVNEDDDWSVDLPALRLLDDCGCVRASINHVGLCTLWDNGIADISEVKGREDLLDYRLTREGRITARNLLGRNALVVQEVT